MTAVDTIVRTLNERFADATGIVTPRANEVHCEIAADGINRLAEFVCRDLGAELIAIAADDRRQEARVFFVHYLFAHRSANWFVHASARVNGGRPELPTIAASIYPASRFERELRDLFGIDVLDHPDPRPLVKHAFWPEQYYPLRKDASAPAFVDDGRPFPFTPVGGEGVYEIPVGPVHAGVIEPGHFRFSVMGETIIDMKSRLYFTHKGTEKLFERRDPMTGVELAERVSGDTSVGHALAYCQAVEAAARIEAPLRARLIRVVLLELERVYNHIADFGAIVNDTGFAVAHAHCFRIRERLLRLNKEITGSRLLRGVLAPGGLARDLTVPADLPARIDAALGDFEEMVAISLANTLVADRLDGTGVLSSELAREYGVLGYVARASGIDIDARRDHPFAAYDQLRFAVPVHSTGDVRARAEVRVDETRESASLLRQACNALAGLGGRPVSIELGRIDPFAVAFGIVEGWRGRIVHWVMVDHHGALHRVKIVDPSFFNWPALSRALTGNIVPDFPLCNKSFNQSYSGNDL
jgi:Ni,Fe-hydrogenase III large subunit/Ni,Fe-hydrogenase III component G